MKQFLLVGKGTAGYHLFQHFYPPCKWHVPEAYRPVPAKYHPVGAKAVQAMINDRGQVLSA